MTKRLDSRTALYLFLFLVVVPAPWFLKALGFWHHNDLALRLLAMVVFDSVMFAVLYSVWRGLPDAGEARRAGGAGTQSLADDV